MKLFSNKRRPVHLGPYPLERLERTTVIPGIPSERKPRPVRKRSEPALRFAEVANDYNDLLDQWQDGTPPRKKLQLRRIRLISLNR